MCFVVFAVESQGPQAFILSFAQPWSPQEWLTQSLGLSRTNSQAQFMSTCSKWYRMASAHYSKETSTLETKDGSVPEKWEDRFCFSGCGCLQLTFLRIQALRWACCLT